MDINVKLLEEQKLFAYWKERDPSIIPDGVVSWRDYMNSNVKILFVLKEVNSDESDWDLREFLRNGSRSFTWNNITRWIIGIRNLNKDYDWNTIKDVDEKKRNENLKSIAAINVKKATGDRDVADNDIIYKHALNDS